MSYKTKVLYVLNGFQQGGAEIGFRTMLEHGFVQDEDLRVFSFFRGKGNLEKEVEQIVGTDRVSVAGKGNRLTAGGLFKGAFALARVLWSWRPDVVILSLKQSNIVGRFLLCFFPSIRCIAIEHNTQIEKKNLSRIYRFLLSLLSFRVCETWADCQTTLDETDSLYIWNQSRIKRLVPLFCPTSNFTVKTLYAASRPFKLVMAGRFTRNKGHDLVLRAMSDLKKEGKEISLTLFGDGPMAPKLRAIVEELDLHDVVSFRGFVSCWWQEAHSFDAFVWPSLYEGFCIVAAEAMMVGLPVLVTPTGGLRDYSSDGVNAIHLRQRTVEGVRQELTKLYDDEGLRSRIGQQAKEEISCRFSKEQVRSQLLMLSQEIARC